MEKSVTATEAVRGFSEILNNIRFKGDHYVIKRGGKPVAYMEPVKEVKMIRQLKELKFILKSLPKLKDELDALAADLQDLWNYQPFVPKESPWE